LHQDIDGNSPLYYALKNSQKDLTRLLVAFGAKTLNESGGGGYNQNAAEATESSSS
jgi:hypothetical protein